jgi:hypothetical protein
MTLDPIVPVEEGNNISSSTVNKQISPAKNWCFTYNNYSEIQQFQDLLLINCLRYIFQEEIGESGTPHLQGFCEFNIKVRPKSVFKEKIHWSKTKDVCASIKYCSKEESRCGRIYAHRVLIPRPLVLIEKLRSWQSDIVDIVLSPPDDRTINWFYEKKGGIGKTVFCKYLAYHHMTLVLSGKSSDMKYGIIKYIEKNGGYPQSIVLDVPRSNLEFLSYTGIEEIKNGIFFSGKYESDMVLGNCPHVIIFANEKPDVSKLSEDRWNIVKL